MPKTPPVYVPFIDGLEAEFIYVLDGQIVTNRLWFYNVSGNDATTAGAAVAGGLATWATDELLPLLSQDITLAEIDVHDASLPYPSICAFATVGTGGLVASEASSANVAVKCAFKTENPPGRELGWVFVPGVPEEAISLNTVDPVYAVALKEAFVVLLDVFSLFEYRWSAVSRFSGGAARAAAVPYRIDHTRVLPNVRQRRRRLPS